LSSAIPYSRLRGGSFHIDLLRLHLIEEDLEEPLSASTNENIDGPGGRSRRGENEDRERRIPKNTFA
jgi:hypothetical protein